VKKIILLFFAVFLFGANLINVNFFEGKNKIDILFSLDDKFNGKVLKLAKDSYELTNIKSDKVFQKEFKNSFVNSIIISPANGGVKIDIMQNGKIKTSVALTPDGYGVRFRIQNAFVAPKVTNTQNLQNLTAKDNGFDMFSYIVALSVLIILALALWYVKKKAPKLPVGKENMRVLIQKPIDQKNRVVLFEFGDRKYLMLVGNTNILLDVFADDISTPKNEVEFDEMLKISKKDEVINKYIKNAEKLKEFDETI
jgi:flagellar biogenesis protein FliO